MKRILISGTHGAGKTALVKRIIAEREIPDPIRYVKSNAGQIIRDNGSTAIVNLTFLERAHIQTLILEDWARNYYYDDGNPNSIVITERSPIDFLAYLSTDVHREMSGEEERCYDEYRRACFDAVVSALKLPHTYFIYVPPWDSAGGPSRDVDKGPIGGYMHHHRYIIQGLLYELQLMFGANHVRYLKSLGIDARMHELVGFAGLKPPLSSILGDHIHDKIIP